MTLGLSIRQIDDERPCPTRSTLGLGWCLRVVVAVSMFLRRQNDKFPNRPRPQDPDDLLAIPELAHLMRSRRHQLGLGESTVLPCPSNDSLEPRRTADSDSANDGGNYTQRSHGKDDIISPAGGEAHKLSSDPFSEEDQQAGCNTSSV